MHPDSELARRAAAGDAAAFTQLVRLHEPAVRRFLRRLLPNDGTEDVAQEVFVKAWRQRAKWRGDGAYRAWLLRIAWTSFATFYAASRRHPDGNDAQAPEIGARPEAETAIDVARAMAALEPRARAAAQLCFAEGCSHAEAAEILALPLGTLKSLIARAKAQLMAALETHDAR
jgi:RNA polymerase sigma-70 factor (ECF subfamily)